MYNGSRFYLTTPKVCLNFKLKTHQWGVSNLFFIQWMINSSMHFQFLCYVQRLFYNLRLGAPLSHHVSISIPLQKKTSSKSNVYILIYTVYTCSVQPWRCSVRRLRKGYFWNAMSVNFQYLDVYIICRYIYIYMWSIMIMMMMMMMMIVSVEQRPGWPVHVYTIYYWST